jgi:GMP synthase-like glutamine amidotransferase
MTSAPALVLEHEADTPAALLAEWAADRGLALEIVPAGQPIPDPAGRPFVVTLGSVDSAYDERVPWLAAERAVLDQAVELDVPVLGICFGAQHLALALGGSVGPAPRPEIGWLDIETFAPGVVPAGPWLQWHHDAFTVPPGAELLARSSVGPQAYRCGPHLGVQFHPEVDAAIVADWVAQDGDAVRAAGGTPEGVLDGSRRHAAGARRRARSLFDAFLASARAARRVSPDAVG